MKNEKRTKQNSLLGSKNIYSIAIFILLYAMMVSIQAQIPSADHSNRNKLVKASQKGDIQQVERLVESGVDINGRTKDGITPLMAAAINGNVSVCRYLIAKGADLHASNNIGLSAMLAAIIGGKIEVVRLLLDSGVKPNECGSHGESPLQLAAWAGKDEIVSILIAQGADINLGGKNGKSSLIQAANANHLSTVQLLLKHGACANVKDNEGKTALDYAKKNGNKKMIQAIREEMDKEVVPKSSEPDPFIEPIRAEEAEKFEAAYQKSLSKLDSQQQKRLRDAVKSILDMFDRNIQKRLAALEEKTGGSSSGDKKKYDTLLRIAQDKELFELTGELDTNTINGVTDVPPPLTEEQIRFSLFDGKSPKRIVEEADGL